VIEALFEPDGGGWVPTGHARGPWNPEHLHGGPVAALLAREAEATTTAGAGPFRVTRLTVELLRPVLLAHLEVTGALVRPGGRVQLVEVEATQDGQPVARARALRIRTKAVSLPGEALAKVPSPPPPGPERGLRASAPRSGGLGFHTTGADLRFVEGSFTEPGPSMVWIRLAVPVVVGEVPSPLQRVVGAADFGNGVGSPLPFDGYLFINPDLSVHLLRQAAGEWVGLEARVHVDGEGIGLAQSRLWDARGVLGRSLQSLLVDRQ
jgi:hypothetical protein